MGRKNPRYHPNCAKSTTLKSLNAGNAAVHHGRALFSAEGIPAEEPSSLGADKSYFLSKLFTYQKHIKL